jgi:geranylgeranyl diphosphate synthase, type I
MMESVELIASMQEAIEVELKTQVARISLPDTTELHNMLTYHMGWTGELSGREAQGKRIRPLLLLLSTSSCGVDWERALPAAASVELIHNFSLIHDDIQDNSQLRRGRPAVWINWGMPQGINAGDSLLILANMAMNSGSPIIPQRKLSQARDCLLSACLQLTRGQFLDISFENRQSIGLEEYWEMVGGKTASLFQSCCEIGALIGTSKKEIHEALSTFGRYLGLIFQVQDDILGIWGETKITGKSNASDLISRKKTLPVVYALQKKGEFADHWERGVITEQDVPHLADLLVQEGALLYSQQIMDVLIDQANMALRTSNPQDPAAEVLFDIIQRAADRKT